MAEKKPNWNAFAYKTLGAVVAILLAALAGWLVKPDKEVHKYVEKPVIIQMDVPDSDALKINTTGWVNDRDAIAKAASQLDVQVFALTPAGQTRDLPKSAYGWKPYEQLFGRPPPMFDQNPTGSCVGFGTTRAVERTLAAEIVLRGGTKEEFSHFSEEVTYAGSRVEANGGTCPIRPNWRDPSPDGSNGGWAAKFVTQWGMVPKDKYGDLDLTEYSASRAHSWNYSGVPDQLEPVARKFPVKSAARITSWKDAKAALANFYGIQIASSLAVGRERDANGVARSQGSWAHSMCLDGYHTDESGREYGHIENSWSKTGYHTGPVGWGNPTEAGFWVAADVIDRALKQGDSYAYSGATGFPRRTVPLDWLIRAEPRRERDPFALFARPEFALAW